MNAQKLEQVYTTSSQLILNINKTSQQKQQAQPKSIQFSISVYPNCVFVIINQTGSIGSILRGGVDVQVQAEKQFDQNQFEFQDFEEKPKTKKQQKQSPYIYECKTIFGSTQIQFYQLIMRRLIELVFQQNKMKTQCKGEKSKVFLNIALSKVHTSQFKAMQKQYYDKIVQRLKQMLPQVI